MGLSALWIVLYHSEIAFTQTDGEGLAHILYILDYHIYLIKSLGQTGVDIFLFLSAIGLFFSLNKDENISSFYKKRLIRILPSFLILSLIYELLTFTSLKESIFNILGINFILNGKRRYWYVFLALLTYAVYPLLYKFEKKRGRWIYPCLMGITIAFNWLLSISCPSLFSNIEIALRRIPVFLLGCFVAEDVKQKKEVSMFILLFALLLLSGSFVYLSSKEDVITVLYRYINSLFAFSIIILVSYLYELLGKTVLLNRITELIEKCGNYTLEYYIGFDISIFVVKNLMHKEKTVDVALLAFVLCVILSYLVKKIINDRIISKRITS